MNERIKELIQEATVFQISVFEENGCRTYGDRVQVFDKEKFAELIVKECLQHCEQIRNDALTQKKSEFLTESGRLIYEGVFGGATNCGFAIQQHFGVEL